MRKTIILFLNDIYVSNNKKVGMPSVDKFISGLNDCYGNADIYLFSNDSKENIEYDNILYTEIRSPFSPISKIRNKYFLFFVDFINFLYLNFVYFFKAYPLIINAKGKVVIYSSVLFSPAALVAKVIGRRQVRIISRMYGVFITRDLKSIKNRIACYKEFLSFKFKFDLYIITNDGTMGDEAARYFGIDDKKVKFMINGVDDVNFQETDSLFDKEKINLFAASRFVSWKRVDRIISAFNKIKKNNIRLKIAGDGDCFDSYKKMSSSEIDFLGMIKNKDVLSYIKNCDIFVSMYDISNIGNPLLQALYFCKPIVTYDSGATKEFLRDFGDNVIVIPKSNNEDDIVLGLIEALEYLIDNPDEMKRMREGMKNISPKLIKTWKERIELELQFIDDLIN